MKKRIEVSDQQATGEDGRGGECRHCYLQIDGYPFEERVRSKMAGERLTCEAMRQQKRRLGGDGDETTNGNE